MPEEVKAKIFEQGFPSNVGKGTGLGRAIALKIVSEKHGSAIAYPSKLRKYTQPLFDAFELVVHIDSAMSIDCRMSMKITLYM